jgi:hypothetical protein
LPLVAAALIEDPRNEPHFSVASLWEVAIKRGLGREDFKVDARLLRRGLLDNGYSELVITSEHAVSLESLPPLHKDPIDRLGPFGGFSPEREPSDDRPGLGCIAAPRGGGRGGGRRNPG